MGDTDFADLLKQAIKRAVDIREGSWNKETNKYEKTLYQAADEACTEVGFDMRMTDPVYLLIHKCWNESIEWANKV
jgi:hypothetical protein